MACGIPGLDNLGIVALQVVAFTALGWFSYKLVLGMLIHVLDWKETTKDKKAVKGVVKK